MSIRADLQTLYHLALRPVRGDTEADRLNSFYGSQAAGYDAFRKRLLHGRERLMSALPLPAGGTWVDMGGGTGANVESVGDRVHGLGRVCIVDLCGQLLNVARQRIRQRRWTNVEAIEADACTFELKEGTADLVTFSYSLSMMPGWFAAIDNAFRLLRPGGWIGVADFYVSARHPPAGQVRHGWLTRSFWPAWFESDGVHLSPDRLAFLQWRFKTRLLLEERGCIPYLPGARVPYFVYAGCRE